MLLTQRFSDGCYEGILRNSAGTGENKGFVSEYALNTFFEPIGDVPAFPPAKFVSSKVI